MPGAPGRPTDRELLDACRSGEREAFGHFYRRYREPVLAYLARRVAEPETAADLMAETFASALVAVRETARPLPSTPVAWLFTISRNLLIDSVRRGRVAAEARERLRLEPLELDDRDIARVIEIAGSAGILERMSSYLSEPEWEALHAHVLDEEPYPDLARRLECSEAVVRKRVSRAKANLRTALRGTDA